MENDEAFKVPTGSSSSHFVGKLSTEMKKCFWSLKMDGINCLNQPIQQISSGICIGSEGFIITAKKSLQCLEEGGQVVSESLCGKTYENDFQELRVLWTDKASDLVILYVADNCDDGNDTKYDYIDISPNLPVRNTQLLAIGNDCGGQAFSIQNCYTSAPAAKMYELVEDTRCVDNPSHTYIPIYGLGGLVVAKFRVGHSLRLTCQYGNGIFDNSGLVGVVSAFIDQQNFSFATPLIAQMIERFEESEELRKYRSKKGRKLE